MSSEMGEAGKLPKGRLSVYSTPGINEEEEDLVSCTCLNACLHIDNYITDIHIDAGAGSRMFMRRDADELSTQGIHR